MGLLPLHCENRPKKRARADPVHTALPRGAMQRGVSSLGTGAVGHQRRGDAIMAGWVSVITNHALPGLVTIGLTERHPENRAGDFNQRPHRPALPFPFVVASVAREKTRGDWNVQSIRDETLAGAQRLTASDRSLLGLCPRQRSRQDVLNALRHLVGRYDHLELNTDSNV